MILFPNAKINLGLKVIERRSDGFHNIETLFIPIDLCDILEFTQSENNRNTIKITGIIPDNTSEDNLVLKAWKLLFEKYEIPHVNIHLHKTIPAGAGLGGGSSDAAFMLKGLNAYFNCGCSNAQLKNMAAELGSDCAFFIENIAAMGTGRGEVLEAIDRSLANYKLLIVNPGIHISSKEAYSGVLPKKQNQSLKDIISMPVEKWPELISNDFEISVFIKHPKIRDIKLAMYKAGAVYASMTGSGSTVFGLFDRSGIGELESLFEGNFVSVVDFL